MRHSALAVVLVVVGLAVWQGTAGAMAERGRQPIQSLNGSCGNSTGGHVIGYVKIQHRRLGLQITWNLKDALPDTVYTLYLYEYAPANCVFLDVLGTVLTDDNGHARKHFMYVPTTSFTSVFTDSWDGSNDNDSVHVNL